jgi:hypothetical protein
VALSLAAAILVGSVAVVPALGQPAASTMISIDSPTEDTTVTGGRQILIGGWAADRDGPGTGVDMVRVYLNNRMDAGGTLLGEATYGELRHDVAAALGSSSFTSTGFNLLWTPTDVSSGQHTLYVYAHSIVDGWTYKTVTVRVDAVPTPAPRTGWQNRPPYGDGLYGPPMMPPPTGSYPYPGGYYQWPGYPSYPGYPGYPGNPNDRVCIMIYPPPPGC